MKSIHLILTLFIIINCKSQKNDIIKLPKINNKTEIYSNAIGERFVKEYRDKRKNRPVKEQFRIGEGYKHNRKGIGFSIYDPVSKRGIVSYTKTGEEVFGKDYSENPIFGVHKIYYSNLTLKTKGIYCVYGFMVGKWYHYDEQGNLTSVEDTDIGYNFTHEDVIRYCEENNIPLVPGDFSVSAEINKIFNKGKHTWVISYYDRKTGYSMTIVLLGKDGSVLDIVNNGKIPVN